MIDDFLPSEFHDGLLRYALDNQARFVPTQIYDAGGERGVNSGFRMSWYCQDGLGQFGQSFKETVKVRFPELLQQLGMPSFAISGVELELVAHRNGSFFRRHIDTATQSARDKQTSDRMISAVYYLHNHPKRFSGGELALFPIRKGEPQLIEPCDNRLVAFASFVLHEVRTVVCPSDDFADARFAVNCWLHRAKNVSAT